MFGRNQAEGNGGTYSAMRQLRKKNILRKTKKVGRQGHRKEQGVVRISSEPRQTPRTREGDRQHRKRKVIVRKARTVG